jgi:hypothetical protein
MPSADNELWDRGHPRQPGDNAGSIARQTVCKWRSHQERKYFVLSLPRARRSANSPRASPSVQPGIRSSPRRSCVI